MKKRLIPALLALSFATAFTVHAASVQPESKPEAVQRTLNTYEQNMVDKVWITAEALDQDKKSVSPEDKRVANFFGVAEYYPDGTFKMTTLDGKPKMQGAWSFSDDGKSRSLTAKNDAGDVLFTRVVENVRVTPEEYTYRVYPEQGNKTRYFDIVHKVKK
ncbi:DUF4822 domain-containing protein [Intestinirhabdus alba]|jgi:hypothetical protein|uniref:DUF4822 domain-containing protein n=1 Tax=Intestinirhabdus alba TaxID=2899544 RepID=A0A6L6ILU2_9ENTR|nr:DUF4822 domain-containing protein [Intestinirhabdus alba]MTH45703.1 DUF4822 domain-containing protein [Intestinirhabdus alba]